MNRIKYRVSLDMFDVATQTTIKVKKGDTACSIYITLAENGKLYHISEGCDAVFSGKKADGNYLFNGETCRIEDNTIIYDFTSQTVACEGIVACEVILSKDGERLTSPRFNLLVDATIYNGEEIVSTPEADALDNLVERTEDALERTEDALERTEDALERTEGALERAEDVLGKTEDLSDVFPEGCSVKYRIAKSGWKRILVTIRSLGGVLQLALGKRGFGDVYQSVGLVSVGYVEFAKQKAGCKPTLYQLYDNEFGDASPSGKARITKARIGYPKPGTTFPIPNEDGAYENPDNPINCYIDVYFEIDKNVEDHHLVKGENPPTQFAMNFFGRVKNHNCYIINEETDVTDSNVGMYGEELKFYELSLNPDVDISIPDGTIEAKEYKGIPTADENTFGLVSLEGVDIATQNYIYGIRDVAKKPGTIAVARANEQDILARTQRYKPIVPASLLFAVKSVIADVMNSMTKSLNGTLDNEPGDFIGQIGKEWGNSPEGLVGEHIYVYCGTGHGGRHRWEKVCFSIEE